MIRFLLSLTAAALVAVVSGQTLTGAFDCMAAGDYTLCQNLWGERTYIFLSLREHRR